MPKSVEVAVVGAGIAGICAAYYLAKRGVRVAVFEKGRIGGEQSSRNWGAVRQQRRHPAELPLMIECNRMWRGLEAELQADLEWRQRGLMHLHYHRKTLAEAEAWLPLAREHRLDTRLLTAREVEATLPNFRADGLLAGLFTPSDGCAEPREVAPAFARAAARLGAGVFPRCAVHAVEAQGGRVCGVQSEVGQVRADAVVVAGGVWSSRLLRALGVHLPSLWVRGSAALSAPLGVALREAVCWGKCAVRARADGSVLLAASEDGIHDVMLDTLRHAAAFTKLGWKNRGLLRFSAGDTLARDLRGEFADFTKHRTLNPPADERSLRRAAAAFAREYPSAPPLQLRRKWAGWIDYLPDELPAIGEADSISGLFVAGGLHGNGFGMGPIVGKVVAELIARGRSAHRLDAFRPERFSRSRSGLRGFPS
ncbi:MAG: FAD-binding oxidoreductase [Gammaproteobacteria bacterium]